MTRLNYISKKIYLEDTNRINIKDLQMIVGSNKRDDFLTRKMDTTTDN